jgi:hypothetical protein
MSQDDLPDPAPDVPEIVLSRWWHGSRHDQTLTTTHGDPIQILHRGNWSHGLGPDFKEAMIVRNDRDLVSGSIEIHLRSSDWKRHGHHLDRAYNEVVLHLVLENEGEETRRADGAVVPVVVLHLSASELEPFLVPAADWSRVGGTVCAEQIALHQPNVVKELLWTLGDRRLASKTARVEARLTDQPPGEILYQDLMDALGFMSNRVPMRELAHLLSLSQLEPIASRTQESERGILLAGLLLGTGGFLPLNPGDAEQAGIPANSVGHMEAAWAQWGSPWRSVKLRPTTWNRARVRPANDPIRRLIAAAMLIAKGVDGLSSLLLGLLLESSEPVRDLIRLSTAPWGQSLGRERATSILSNAVLPYAFALASQTSDDRLLEAAVRTWDRLPSAGSNEITRRALRQVAGTAPIRGIGERGHQGLIHLDATLCQPRRCFECPIGTFVVESDEATVRSQ